MKPEAGEIRIGDHIVTFTVARSARRRRTIAFEMPTPTMLKITAPKRASLTSIQSVLKKQSGWIQKRVVELQRVDSGGKFKEKPSYKDGDSVTYLGRDYKISVTNNPHVPQGCTLLPHRLIVNLHAGSLKVDNQQEEVRLEILLWLKKRAKVKFEKRMDCWAKELNVNYQKLIVANAERRWGSCSPDNVIRLNWRLLFAPLRILDYVVVHELCHVKNKNHGPRFWGQVASVMPDYKICRRHLRLMGGSLIL